MTNYRFARRKVWVCSHETLGLAPPNVTSYSVKYGISRAKMWHFAGLLQGSKAPKSANYLAANDLRQCLINRVFAAN